MGLSSSHVHLRTLKTYTYTHTKHTLTALIPSAPRLKGDVSLPEKNKDGRRNTGMLAVWVGRRGEKRRRRMRRRGVEREGGDRIGEESLL